MSQPKFIYFILLLLFTSTLSAQQSTDTLNIKIQVAIDSLNECEFLYGTKDQKYFNQAILLGNLYLERYNITLSNDDKDSLLFFIQYLGGNIGVKIHTLYNFIYNS